MIQQFKPHITSFKWLFYFISLGFTCNYAVSYMSSGKSLLIMDVVLFSFGNIYTGVTHNYFSGLFFIIVYKIWGKKNVELFFWNSYHYTNTMVS